MGKEEFAFVFAPSAREVEGARNRHHRAAWAWLVIALALMVSLVLCCLMFLGEPGEVFAGTALAQLAVILMGLLLLALLITIGIMIYHECKASDLSETLEQEYISNTWRKTEYY